MVGTATFAVVGNIREIHVPQKHSITFSHTKFPFSEKYRPPAIELKGNLIVLGVEACNELFVLAVLFRIRTGDNLWSRLDLLEGG